MEAAGIPDSKPPVAPEGTFPEQSILDCHVGGVPVRNLPLEVQGRILYQQTDEGIEEANRDKEPGAVRVTKDEFSKACENRKDAITGQGMQPWEAPDPLREVAQRYVRPGFRPRFLAPAAIDQRGMRGVEPVSTRPERGSLTADAMSVERVSRSRTNQRSISTDSGIRVSRSGPSRNCWAGKTSPYFPTA